MATVDFSRVSTSGNLRRIDRIKRPKGHHDGGDGDEVKAGKLEIFENSMMYADSMPLAMLRQSFLNDGFLVFHDAIDSNMVSNLQERLELVLSGNFDRGSPPDKIPRFLMNSQPKKKGKKTKKLGPLGHDKDSSNKNRVLQIINIHKCDELFRELAMSPNIGKMVAELAGWRNGARLAQDQVWAKPPGAPPIVFHRDSPYFMFTPDDVITVWVALDDMGEELGPLEYVKGSHKWGSGRVGSAQTFFQSDNGRSLLNSAALLEGITDPSSSLEIYTTSGLRAGGISVHNGKVWHGSGKNCSGDRPRRGLGLHYVPAEVRFTKEAAKSKLWKIYLPDDIICDEDATGVDLPEGDFPVVWRPT